MFSDFFDECPICSRKKCAVRIGYYYRWAIDIDIDTHQIEILYIPIARFLCKTKPKGKHHTFSLLPDNLIPYNRFSIDLLIYILKLLILEKQTTNATLEQIDTISPDSCLISDKILKHLLYLLEQTRIKLILFFEQFPEFNKAPPQIVSFTIYDTLKYLIKYPSEPLHFGAYYLCSHYYEIYGSYRKNSRFLFGTASQFCINAI